MLAKQSNSVTARPTRESLKLLGPDGARPRLLLAEDSDPVRVVTAAMLKGMGCDVKAVVHGEEALKSAASGHFDVIVLDIEMPVMDGITAARSIRKLGGPARTTPIMALSAFLADAMQSASWSDTFDIALPKPANRNELHAAVKAALDRHPGRKELAEVPAEPIICAELLVQLRSGLSRSVWMDLLAIARRDIETFMAAILVQTRDGDQEGVAHTAYKLMALGRTFAAPRLASVAKRLSDSTVEDEAAGLLALLVETSEATTAALKAELS